LVNPYESPSAAAEPIASGYHSRWRAVRILLCLINFSIAALFVVSGVPSPEVRFGVEVAILLVIPFALYAVLELIAIFLPSVEWTLGFANLGCGGLACFGVVVNAYEAVVMELADWSFYAIFLPVMGGVAAYLLTCGWIRVRLKLRK
jgi:hypothetical protein